ncbi:hypothetical protein B0H14DRAFT_3437869 [Mycena olivaceomarginata]|nr:hypothetical protein B0H14DRAFT_3437869 [Mycena olivaceomarginata]
MRELTRTCSKIPIRERRSRTVQTAVDVVDAFYKSKDYIDQPAAIRAHARYALRVDDPAFFKNPTPENCPRNIKDPGYIKPKGYLESDLMIQTVSPFLKNEEFIIPEALTDGTYDFSGMPAGLFSLTAAGAVSGYRCP